MRRSCFPIGEFDNKTFGLRILYLFETTYNHLNVYVQVQLIGSTISELALTNQGVVAHLITPLADLKVDNVKADQVVGKIKNQFD